MSDIRIETSDGSYGNEDVYNNVIGYISNKTYWGGYGFYCSPDISVIEQFKASEAYSDHTNDQKIWHFWITFSRRWSENELLNLADHIAQLFSSEYQIIYGVDMEERNPHLHFGINAFSYHPDHPVLTPEFMHSCLENLQNILRRWYPCETVTLQFRGKKG